MLEAADWFFTIFHLGLTGFNLVGWAFAKTRKIHFWSMLVTLSAWVLIGIYVGRVGYCPLTDWHWDIKRELGQAQLPGSFIKYYIDLWFNYDFDRILVDWMTGIGGVLAFLISVYLNFLKKPSI